VIPLIVKNHLGEMTEGMFNASGVQLELPQTWVSSSISQSALHSAIPKMFVGWSNWQYILTFLLGVIFYDQGKHGLTPDGYHQLTMDSVMYIKRKGSIAGPAFKIPLMGPFIQALHPKFDSYLAQWASGPLSCVSVFHKYVTLSEVLHFMR
jgi:C-22 sterol desaturase